MTTQGRADSIHHLPPEAAARYRHLRVATDELWVRTAAELGFHIVRQSGAFVAYDGQGTIQVAPYGELDDDDLLAQIVLHEVCHHLIEGDSSRHAPDWGLDNTGRADEPRERAALRLQARWLDEHGLRDVLVPTTDFRTFYDGLGATPLAGSSADAVAARAAWGQRPAAIADRLDHALRKTADALSAYGGGVAGGAC